MRRGTIGPDDDVTPWFRHQRWRPVLFCAGLLLTFIALESPIDRGGDYYLFSLHMVQHMVLMMVAPPLLLLGIAGRAACAATTPQHAAHRLVGGDPPLAGGDHLQRGAPALAHPIAV